MKLSKGTMLDLMAYADGELEGDEKKRIEALLAKDDDARRAVSEMQRIGVIAGRIYEAPAASLSAGIADAVLAQIAEERAKAKDDAKDDTMPRKLSSRPPKVVDLRDARERRLKVGGAVVAVVALAAGIILTTRSQNEKAPVAKLNPPQETVPAPAPAPAPAPEQVAVAGVDVEQVDSTHEVEVYYLPSSIGKNASSVVVWIDDKAAGTPGPGNP